MTKYYADLNPAFGARMERRYSVFQRTPDGAKRLTDRRLQFMTKRAAERAAARITAERCACGCTVIIKPVVSLCLVTVAAVALSACARPSPVVAGCFLRYVPPPESPFSSSGSTPPTISLPNPHNCLLTLPSSIVDGGSISIAPEAYAAARVRS